MSLADNALTTVAAVEIVVGEGVYPTPRIEQLINIVSGTAERICKRTFGAAAATESYRGTGRTMLTLDRTPIISVASVTDSGSAVTDYSRDAIRDRQGMLYREGTWPKSVPLVGLAQNPNTNQVAYNFRVTYTAGYVLPNDEDLEADPPVVRTLPYELEGAVLDEIVERLKSGAVNPALKSERTPGGYSYELYDVRAADERFARRLTALGYVRVVVA